MGRGELDSMEFRPFFTLGEKDVWALLLKPPAPLGEGGGMAMKYGWMSWSFEIGLEGLGLGLVDIPSKPPFPPPPTRPIFCPIRKQSPPYRTPDSPHFRSFMFFPVSRPVTKAAMKSGEIGRAISYVFS